MFVGTQYFRRKWVPLLGASLAWVIMALRQHCYWSRETGEKRDWCLISQDELAAEAGISVATLKRLLKHEHAPRFIIDITHRYRYDPQKRKQVRRKSMYRIRMDDPLTPEDEIKLKEKVAERLSGLNIDPETGQVDMLHLLDQLAEPNGHHDLTLTMTPTDNLDEATDQLVDRLSQFLSGGPSNEPSVSTDSPPYASAVRVPLDQLRDFKLSKSQILVTWNDEYLAVPMVEIIKRDLRLTGGHPTTEQRTDCFYSVADALGEAPQEWLPEEQDRLEQMTQLEAELSQLYQRLGAFSLDEALAQFFSPDLTARFLTDVSDAERQRIQAWVMYTRQAQSLKNPAGFLRSRIESGELPPA